MMVVVRPFKGLRPRQDLAEKIASPPYDVLDSDEARKIVKENPRSFLRVVKPEVDIDPGIDVYSEQVYQKGASNLRQLIEEGTLKQDSKPMFYFYRQIMGKHSQVGLVATVSADDYENGLIKKHEFTRPDKEADRVKHIMTQRAQCGPVFLTYPDAPELNALQENVCSKEPDVDFEAEDEVRHTLWTVDDDTVVDKIQNIFSKVGQLYVADGHHRSAAGTIVARNMRTDNPAHTGDEEYNFFLTVIFPKSHMSILAYNRVVLDLNHLNPEEFLKRVGKEFVISENAGPAPDNVHQFSMYLEGVWYGLSPVPGSYPDSDPVKSLDYSILQDNLLAPLLGIDDPRTSLRIKFVGGIRGTEELERLVDSGKYKVAFSLYPVTLDQLFAVADSGNVMPPKCTWFEPKLRSGLVIHLF
jgi:uncharacterized protein (DUF1015 family)